jgi:Mn-dependent DtxR family transcriptional regulator
MRHADEDRVRAIWQTVQRRPGIRPGRIARQLGVPRSSVTRALPALDEAGLLLSEDRRGGLWPWRRIR